MERDMTAEELEQAIQGRFQTQQEGVVLSMLVPTDTLDALVRMARRALEDDPRCPAVAWNGYRCDAWRGHGGSHHQELDEVTWLNDVAPKQGTEEGP